MNQRILAAADAVAKAFADYKSESLLIPLEGENKFPVPIPDEKFDKEGWKEFLNALKYRHKLEAFRTTVVLEAHLLVAAYGYMSNAPVIGVEEVQEVVRQQEQAEEVANEQFDSLMKRLK